MLTTLVNVSYASFPIMDNNSQEVLSTTNFKDPDDDEMQSWEVFVAILIPIVILGGIVSFVKRIL
jgi:hypothetical protein